MHRVAGDVHVRHCAAAAQEYVTGLATIAHGGEFGETAYVVILERHVDRVLRIRDGRTSTETRAATGELLIVDAAGRLQIPKSVREEANLGARVRVRVENGRVIIENVDDT